MVIGGRYRIEETLGRGGFGTVYAARHTGTNQQVAVKVLNTAENHNEMLLARFFREAKVTAALKHPNTIRVFDYGHEEDGVVFIAMERLVGRSLRDEMIARRERDERFGEEEAARVMSVVLRSLGEAHTAGLVHRDLKPDNIFLHDVPGDEPTIKVLDFGIAKLRDSDLTGATVVPCTPEFASPEQALGRAIDGRSDLYAVGINLFYMVTGKLPFTTTPRVQILRMQISQVPPDLRTWPGIRLSEAFVQVVEKALAKPPEARFCDAAEMRRALDACVYGAAARDLMGPVPTPATRIAGSTTAPSRGPISADLEPETPCAAFGPATRCVEHVDDTRPAIAAATPLVEPPTELARTMIETAPLLDATQPQAPLPVPATTAQNPAQNPARAPSMTPPWIATAAPRRPRPILIGVIIAAIVVCAMGAGALIQSGRQSTSVSTNSQPPLPTEVTPVVAVPAPAAEETVTLPLEPPPSKTKVVDPPPRPRRPRPVRPAPSPVEDAPHKTVLDVEI